MTSQYDRGRRPQATWFLRHLDTKGPFVSRWNYPGGISHDINWTLAIWVVNLLLMFGLSLPYITWI